MLRMGTGWEGVLSESTWPRPSPRPHPGPLPLLLGVLGERELCKTTSFRRKPESRGDRFVAGQVRRTSHLVAF